MINVLADRRKTPLLAIANALFSGLTVPSPTSLEPARTVPAQSIRELLASGLYSLEDLRNVVSGTTSNTIQGLVGFTTPITPHWQAGADIRLTDVGEIPRLDSLGFPGQGRNRSTALGGQLIGTNFYSIATPM
ncbi:hypothetical protein FSC37_21355 [Piscinibacter aquaticus]|uniref:Plug domain-containing protein n=1 Tax=Piscinibacter aquaticus TaxID=392597 RepID=A0A5C6U3G2_9BURK|nr:hypothetical protein FSC37_21355 [Piscinibacter aquaticus]